MLKIGIIIGSTRPQRNGEAVGKWVFENARGRSDAEFELIDLKDYNLPLLDEPVPPAGAGGNYTKEHTKKWAQKIASLDAFIFVTPEYNFGMNAALKNAIDFLFPEWNNKAAGFVGYGSAGAARAIVQLRTVMGAVQIADVNPVVSLSTHSDFENMKTFKPADRHLKSLDKLIDEVIKWGQAMKQIRSEKTR